MLVEKYYNIGEVSALLAVSVVTLRRWCRSDKLRACRRTLGNHRRYSQSLIYSYLGIEQPRKVIGYARVSSHDQKNDLVRQSDVLRSHVCDEVITDLGSGLNCKKRGLLKLLKLIVSNEISTLVLTHKDRLLRFGVDLILNLCTWHKVEVIYLTSTEEDSFEVELSKDVITWMTVFCARLYGKRSHKNKKKNKVL